MLSAADNKGNVIAPMTVTSVNVHDSALFDYSFTKLLDLAQDLNLNIHKSFIALDSGFDSAFDESIIISANLMPVIKPNIRGLKNREKIYRMLDEFESLEYIYKERYKIERCFAWEDTYRKPVIRYERLQAAFMGFGYLAYSMINCRNLFK